MNDFLEKLAEIFEVDVNDINPQTNFREEIEYWSSLMGFSILIMLEEDYNVKLSADDFMKCVTVGDLAEKAGL